MTRIKLFFNVLVTPKKSLLIYYIYLIILIQSRTIKLSIHVLNIYGHSFSVKKTGHPI